MNIARPKNFDEIKGNAKRIKRIQERIADNTLGKFHIICGVPGIGKTSLAYIMAKAKNCLSTSRDELPCGKCESCLEIDKNVIELEKSTNNVKLFSMPSENATDTISQVIGELNTNFLARGEKFLIIDELQNLRDSQQRDLLKPFETIPDGVTVIACTTDMSSIIEALQSRAIIHRLRGLSNSDLKWLLKKEAYRRQLRIDDEDRAFEYIASWADNKARPALKCLEELGKAREVDLDEILDVIEYLPLTDIIPIITSFKGSYIKGIKVIENLTYDDTTFKSIKLLLLDVLKIVNREPAKNIPISDYSLVKEALVGISTDVILQFCYNVMGIIKFDISTMTVAYLKSHPALNKLTVPNKSQLDVENSSASMNSRSNDLKPQQASPKLDMNTLIMNSKIVKR